ncbi:GroES-like protein [Aspergillus uvarum CBS 121591]|uniref:GroES-like protein n=1 Tax=Aspergillus uvarum CBS 121591 TaxID=1448315 RepID=A0A319D626_9EURO|nr:GroES-like protein [Aspergillus uvarum CBS 121591]PYH83378.1 GroES-like protein [Aspergillus uvarum CBS 121591]
MFRTIVRAFGPPKEVVTGETCDPPPIPGPGQVLVRMLLASINPSDLIPITGAYRTRTSLPFVPGFEGVGMVEAVGAHVSELKVGDRVLPLGSAGAWQDFKLSEEQWCFPVPADLTDQQAAMAYINPLTAWMMTKEYAPAPPATVVVNAATSAIGQMIIRMLNRVGVRPIALTRRPDVLDQLMNGSDVTAVICPHDGDLKQRLYKLTESRGLNVAYDAVGGSEGNDLARSLARGGRLIHYGLLSGVPLSPSLYRECPDVQIVLFRLRDWVHTSERRVIQSALDEVFDLVREGIAESKVARVFQLSSFKEALDYEATLARNGKVLLSMSPDLTPMDP